MTRLLIPLVLLLAACGIDGPPSRPAPDTPPPGLSLSGDAAIGVKYDSGRNGR